MGANHIVLKRATVLDTTVHARASRPRVQGRKRRQRNAVEGAALGAQGNTRSWGDLKGNYQSIALQHV